MITEAERTLFDENEALRLQCLRSLEIMDTTPDPALDALTRALTAQLDCPISLVSLVDDERQWFKSRRGLAASETPREWAFCAHAIAAGKFLEVPDAAADPRFQHNPLVTGAPHIRFYAGEPLVVRGQAIGTLCAIDRRPRRLSSREREVLHELALVAQICIERSSVQRRVELSEVRLGDMLRAASDFIWEIDARRRFVWLSEGVEATLGLPASSLIGHALWNPLVLNAMGEPLPGRPSLHDSLGHGGTPVRLLVELPVRGIAQGTGTRPLLLCAVAVRDADGGMLGWRGTAKDVAALLEGSRRSRELELRLTNVAAQLPGVIFVLERQPGGLLRMPYASDGLQRVFDLAPEAVAEDAMALFANVPAPQRKALLTELLRSGESGEAWTFECPVQRPPERDRWVGGRATPRRLADGRMVWYGYAADFTERRIAARAMGDAQRRVQLALNIGKLGVVVVDSVAGTVELDANARRIHGLPSGEADVQAGPQPLAEWLLGIAGTDRDAIRLALTAARTPAKPSQVSYQLLGRGEPVQIELQIERTATQRLVGLCRDITVQERTARAQREQLRLETVRQHQTEFLSRVSHELRTPMNAIIGFVDLMRTDAQTPMALRHREWSQHVMSAGQHLMTLINDLLDLTRIDTGHHAMSPVSLRVDRMLLSCQALLEPIALRSHNLLAVPRGEPALHVLADRRALGQVLVNLIGNAIKFNRSGGTVSCNATAVGQRCVIRVCDEGPGIPADRRHRLFQPFERLGRSQATHEGSGLGLAITRRLVEAMQGTVTAEFPASGGTCMVIDLPLAELQHDDLPDTPPAPLTPNAKAALAAAAPRRAIYAEDNPVNAMLLQAMFEMRSDWTLDVVDNAAALHAALAGQPYELVLLDINLGSASGLDVVRELRSDPALHGLTCIALSADGLADQIAAAMRAGFDDYWTKPIEIGELHRRLDSLPRRRSANRAA